MVWTQVYGTLLQLVLSGSASGDQSTVSIHVVVVTSMRYCTWWYKMSYQQPTHFIGQITAQAVTFISSSRLFEEPKQIHSLSSTVFNLSKSNGGRAPKAKIIVFDPMMCKSPDAPLQDELLCWFICSIWYRCMWYVQVLKVGRFSVGWFTVYVSSSSCTKFRFRFSFYHAAWNADVVLRWEFCLSVKRVHCDKRKKNLSWFLYHAKDHLV